MDFYESARFQYAASRLLVKLENFRRTGEFPKKITYKNTPDIEILPARSGSFGIDVIVPALVTLTPILIEVPISALLSYVIDRVFRPADDEAIREALATNRELVQTFDKAIAGRDATIERTLTMLQNRMDNDDDLNTEIRGLYERLIADSQRRSELGNFRSELRKIGEERSAELVTMAAPLLKEMNVPLRKSASSITIKSKRGKERRDLLRANKAMADAVDLALVDRFTTTIDIDIVQFNKENGWGKFQNEEWDGYPSFNIPGDILDDIKHTVLDAMNYDLVEAECYFVRSPSGIPQRIILVDVNVIDEL